MCEVDIQFNKKSTLLFFPFKFLNYDHQARYDIKENWIIHFNSFKSL